jgi:hypothetical protein
MSNSLEQSLTGIPRLTRPALCGEYRRLYQLDPPLNLSRRLLELAVAYRLQEKAFGGLKPAIRKELFNGQASAGKKLSSGSVLVREWHGVHHTVVVNGLHVEYQGQRFRSLSAVARLITGSHRSGTAFFGIKELTHGD